MSQPKGTTPSLKRHEGPSTLVVAVGLVSLPLVASVLRLLVLQLIQVRRTHCGNARAEPCGRRHTRREAFRGMPWLTVQLPCAGSSPAGVACADVRLPAQPAPHLAGGDSACCFLALQVARLILMLAGTHCTTCRLARGLLGRLCRVVTRRT
jgi:hypothetical protein